MQAAPRLRRVRADVGQRRPPTSSALLGIVEPYLPEQAWFYDADALTDRSERFLASEIVREKLFRLTGDELPYTSHRGDRQVRGEQGDLRRIAATIVVERDAHKGMVIGEGGERLKRIGTEARQELERLMEAQGVPRALGQGALRLGRQRGAPALATATSRRSAPCARPDMASRPPARAAGGLCAAPLRLERIEPDPRPVHARARPRGRGCQGRQAAVSQLRAVLLPFQRIQASSAARRRGGAEVQTCAAPNGPAACRCSTGAALFSGFYLNELLMKLLARARPAPAALRCLCRHRCRAWPAPTRPRRSGAARLRAALAARDRPAARPRRVDADPGGRCMPARGYALRPEAGVDGCRAGTQPASGA